MTARVDMPATRTKPDETTRAMPARLAAWIQERGFDVCPWHPAPTENLRKVTGKDAWRFGKVVLARVSLEGTNQKSSTDPRDSPPSELPRYYVAICPGPMPGLAVGYWFEVIHRRARSDDSPRRQTPANAPSNPPPSL